MKTWLMLFYIIFIQKYEDLSFRQPAERRSSISCLTPAELCTEICSSPCSLCVQTSSEAHPASYAVGTWSLFSRGKSRPGRDSDHSPHLVSRSRMTRSYIPLLLSSCMAWWDTFTLTALCIVIVESQIIQLCKLHFLLNVLRVSQYFRERKRYDFISTLLLLLHMS
jgi:hypothetical protein